MAPMPPCISDHRVRGPYESRQIGESKHAEAALALRCEWWRCNYLRILVYFVMYDSVRILVILCDI